MLRKHRKSLIQLEEVSNQKRRGFLRASRQVTDPPRHAKDDDLPAKDVTSISENCRDRKKD
jgi:hypothetical protein